MCIGVLCLECVVVCMWGCIGEGKERYLQKDRRKICPDPREKKRVGKTEWTFREKNMSAFGP